jgi:hypothetical protein
MQIGYIGSEPEGKIKFRSKRIEEESGPKLWPLFSLLLLSPCCAVRRRRQPRSPSVLEWHLCARMGTSRTLHTTARLTAITDLIGLLGACLSEPALGSTVLSTFPAMSITGLTLVTVTKDRCLRAEMSLRTISTATRREMGKATWSKAIMTPPMNTSYPDISRAVATHRSTTRTRSRGNALSRALSLDTDSAAA